jgi:hypothetical protein
LKIFEAHHGLDHAEVAFALNNLAMLYVKLDRVHESAELCQRAVAILETHNSPDLPSALNNLAEYRLQLGNHLWSMRHPLTQSMRVV